MCGGRFEGASVCTPRSHASSTHICRHTDTRPETHTVPHSQKHKTHGQTQTHSDRHTLRLTDTQMHKRTHMHTPRHICRHRHTHKPKLPPAPSRLQPGKKFRGSLELVKGRKFGKLSLVTLQLSPLRDPGRHTRGEQALTEITEAGRSWATPGRGPQPSSFSFSAAF